MTQWVILIQLFDSTLVPKTGKNFTIPEKLSQRLLLHKDEYWALPVAFDKMKDPVQSIDEDHEKGELQVKICLIFGPIRHPNGHKEAGYFWEQYGQWKDMHDFSETQ